MPILLPHLTAMLSLQGDGRSKGVLLQTTGAPRVSTRHGQQREGVREEREGVGQQQQEEEEGRLGMGRRRHWPSMVRRRCKGSRV